MKKIFKTLTEISKHYFYYRAMVTKESIDVKIYSKESNSSPEFNYVYDNDEQGRHDLNAYLNLFLDNLKK